MIPSYRRPLFQCTVLQVIRVNMVSRWLNWRDLSTNESCEHSIYIQFTHVVIKVIMHEVSLTSRLYTVLFTGNRFLVPISLRQSSLSRFARSSWGLAICGIFMCVRHRWQAYQSTLPWTGLNLAQVPTHSLEHCGETTGPSLVSPDRPDEQLLLLLTCSDDP